MPVAYLTKSWVKATGVVTGEETLERFADADTITGVGITSATNWLNAADTATVKGIAEIDSTEDFTRVDSGMVTGEGEVLGADAKETSSADTITGVGIVSATSFAETSPAISTIIGIGVISSTDVHDSVDAGTVTGDGTVSATFEFDDAAVVTGRAYTTEKDDDAAFIDAGTATGVGLISATEKRGFTDVSTVAPVGIGSAVDIAQYVDQNIAIGMGIPANEYVDEGTVIGGMETETIENFDWNDLDTVVGVTELDTLEEYIRTIEDSTVTGVGVLSWEEVSIGTGTGTVEAVGIASAALEYIAARGTNAAARIGGVAALVGSGAKVTTYTKTGIAQSSYTVSGIKVRTFANAVDGYVNGGAITGITTATPMVVTIPSHGFVAGQVIDIKGVVGATDANNKWVVGTVPNANTFQLLNPDSSNSTTAQTYTSGGYGHNGFRIAQVATAAQIGLIANGGHIGVATGNVNSLTNVITVPAGGVPKNALVWVGNSIHNNTLNVGSVTDTRGNTYTLVGPEDQGTVIRLHGAYARLSTALLAGDTITLTYASGNQSSNRVTAAHWWMGASGTPDTALYSGGGTGTTVNQGPTTSTLANDHSLVLAQWVLRASNSVSDSGLTISTGGYTEGTEANGNFATTNRAVAYGWKVLVGDTTAQSVAATQTNNQEWRGHMFVFPPTAEAALTIAAHGYQTNDLIHVSGAAGMTGINGLWEIDVVDVNNFILRGSAPSGSYTASTARVAKMSGTPYTTSNTQFPELPAFQRYNA